MPSIINKLTYEFELKLLEKISNLIILISLIKYLILFTSSLNSLLKLIYTNTHHTIIDTQTAIFPNNFLKSERKKIWVSVKIRVMIITIKLLLF